jgi:hypothetical protein
MTVEVQSSVAPEAKANDKEFNFRQIEKRLQEEKAEKERIVQEKEQLASELEELKRRSSRSDDDEEQDDEPYIDRKRLKKEQAKFGQQIKQETQSEIQRAVQTALGEERKQNWLKNNPDFYDVLQHAEKLAQKDPELAETILEMPNNFERQKLVYKNVKAFGLHMPERKEPSIQEKVDANRRSPYYQPSGVAAAPYAGAGDFSPVGQKNAFDKMKELQNRLRI